MAEQASKRKRFGAFLCDQLAQRKEIVKMAKKSLKKHEELMAKMEEQKRLLDVISSKIDVFISNLDYDLEYARKGFRVIGKKSEQATNWHGELLYTEKGGYYHRTLECFLKEGLTEDDVEPYYEDLTEEYIKTDEELDKYESNQIRAMEILKKALSEIEFDLD